MDIERFSNAYLAIVGSYIDESFEMKELLIDVVVRYKVSFMSEAEECVDDEQNSYWGGHCE